MRMAKKLLTPTHCSLLLFLLQIIFYEIDAWLSNQNIATDCHLIYGFCTQIVIIEYNQLLHFGLIEWFVDLIKNVLYI